MVGEVAAVGQPVTTLKVGDLVGIAWLRKTCGNCEWCRSGRENLCPLASFNGWDADGGFAEFMTVPESFAHQLPIGTDPVETAPLLCAGIIGYRSLLRSALPRGGDFGLYGFGSGAHLTARSQEQRALGFLRSPRARRRHYCPCPCRDKKRQHGRDRRDQHDRHPRHKPRK